MCESYRYASDVVYNWHMEHEDRFPNEGKPLFAFNLDGGYKLSKLGHEGNYLQTH